MFKKSGLTQEELAARVANAQPTNPQDGVAPQPERETVVSEQARSARLLEPSHRPSSVGENPLLTELEALSSGGSSTPDQPPTAETRPESPELPDKFKGKSLEDIVQAYINLEKQRGEMANELGQQRRLAEALLSHQQQAPQAPPAQPPVEDIKFDEDDLEGSIQRLIKRSVDEATAPLLQEIGSLKGASTRKEMVSNHPDWQDIIKTEDFREFVMSDEYLVDLYNRGDRGDYKAGNTLFNLYKRGKGAAGKAEPAPAPTAEAALETGVARSPVHTTKPDTISRADVRRLARENPDAYERALPAIRKAYAEGRVRP